MYMMYIYIFYVYDIYIYIYILKYRSKLGYTNNLMVKILIQWLILVNIPVVFQVRATSSTRSAWGSRRWRWRRRRPKDRRP